MKAYGHDRYAKLECQYGCCTGKAGKDRDYRVLVDRAARKAARQLAKKQITHQLY